MRYIAPERRETAGKRPIASQREINTLTKTRAAEPLFLRYGGIVIIATEYEVEEMEPGGPFIIHNRAVPICPKCGMLLTGYDRRRRSVILSSGEKASFLLRRLLCRRCGQLHLELPDIMKPRKHYEARLITGTITGSVNHCPADSGPIEAEPEEAAPDAESIAIPGYDELVLRARSIEQQVDFYNPEGNGCYFVISVLLPDGAELFKSGLIAPGSRLTSIDLSHALEAGTYAKAVLRYSCFRVGDMAQLNGADILLTLEVES